MNETGEKTISPSARVDECITRVENGLITMTENGQPQWGSMATLAERMAYLIFADKILFLLAMPQHENTAWDLTNGLLVAPWFIAVLALIVVALAAIAWWKRLWKPAWRVRTRRLRETDDDPYQWPIISQGGKW